MLALSSILGAQQMLPWNNSGLAQSPNQPPRRARAGATRDLTGTWDAGGAGIGARGYPTAPLTPWGEALGKTHKAGDGVRWRPSRRSTIRCPRWAIPAGSRATCCSSCGRSRWSRRRTQVLMLYMFEKRWRTSGPTAAQLPKDPDPRWYGYSVGRWEDDSTFVVDSNGTDERTWLDNAGSPHSDQMKVEERYHRVDQDTMELTVTIDDPKAYTKPWVARNKLRLRLMPPSIDLIEMIPSATEAAEYKKVFGK